MDYDVATKYAKQNQYMKYKKKNEEETNTHFTSLLYF